MSDRLRPLISALTDNTLLGAVLFPIEQALGRCRANNATFRTLNMADFITLGVLRHLQGILCGRAHLQSLAHEVAQLGRTPLARSTWGDALASNTRHTVLVQCVVELLRIARARLPDRLKGFSSLTGRAVYAVDGSYQKESAHFRRRSPKDGGEDNAKGHCLLSFFDLRLGCVIDAAVETRSRHEVPVLRDYDDDDAALTREHKALWVVDRGFIDAPWWDQKKRRLGATMITRWREDLVIDSNEMIAIDVQSCNEGVLSDQRITLKSSGEFWRLIMYQTPRGPVVKFLSNDFTLQPGEIAFIYSRRWEEEKAFDVWKNDFAMAKAWGMSKTSITNQLLLAIITSVLLSLFLHENGCGSDADDKSQQKQSRRAAGRDGGTDRPAWSEPLYRFTTRLSKQVLRFFRCCYRQRMSPRLIDGQLRPLLQCYM